MILISIILGKICKGNLIARIAAAAQDEKRGRYVYLVNTMNRIRHRFRGLATPPESGETTSAAVENLTEPGEVSAVRTLIDGIAPLVQRAERAKAQGQWPEAAQFYTAAIDDDPDSAALSAACAEAYRHADDPQTADLVCQHFTKNHGMTIEIGVAYALNAQHRQDWEAAAERWWELRVAFPDISVAWAAETAMLLLMGQAAEAESLISAALSRFPAEIDILAQSIGVAIARSDWPEAAARLELIRDRDRLSAEVRSHIAGLRQTVDTGFSTMPDSDLIAAAVQADGRHDWSTARRYWGLLYDRDPGNEHAAIGLGQALRELGLLDEADHFFDAAFKHIPDNTELLANHAQVAVARRDWNTAAARWHNILERFPNTSALWPMAATAYSEAGQFDAADDLLRQAITVAPESPGLRIQHALLAERQENWPLAIERWDLAHQLWPDEPNIRNSRGDAIWQEAIGRLERGEAVPGPVWDNIRANDSDVPPEEMKTISLRFEGLGDNCEFGIVQRHFGADPIGLFRFAAISAGTLIDLLDERFDRLGDPQFTELALTAGQEYLVRDVRGLYHLHCFVRQGSVDEAQFLRKQILRLTYLKRKLLEDLEEDSKIFVYKSSLERMDDETAVALHHALLRHGANHLLIIRMAEAEFQPGTVAVLRPGLLVGYVDTLYSGEGSAIDFESWRRILLGASRYYRTAGQSRTYASVP